MHRLLSVLAVVALLVSSCGDGATSAAGLDDEIATLIEAAEDVRGLTFVETPNVVIVSAGELADRIRAQIEEDLDRDEIVVDQHLFEMLGLLDGSVDLLEAYTELYAEAVGGFYDNDTGEMVIAGDEALGPLGKTIVVHELVHALTDQHFDFASKLDQLIDEERFQEASAIQALAEGDATYFQLLYMQTLPTSEQVEAVQESLAADTSVADALPDWFSEDLAWPYDSGFAFVNRLVTDLGVSGLDQAYTLLPTTSEHIMHPGSYFTRQPPRSAGMPEVVLDGYEVTEDGEWGEWNLQLYLLDGVEPGEAVVAATGWGGDHYRIYWNGTDVAFAYLYVGDSQADADELARSLASSVRERVAVGSGLTTVSGTTFSPADDFAFIGRDGARVLFVVAGDPVVGSTLTNALRPVLASG